MKNWITGAKDESPKMIAEHAKEKGLLKGLGTYINMLRNMSIETPKTNKQKANDKAKRKIAKKSKRRNR